MMVGVLLPGLKSYGRQLGWEMLSVAVSEEPGKEVHYVLDHKLIANPEVRKEVAIPEGLFTGALRDDNYKSLVEFYRNALFIG